MPSIIVENEPIARYTTLGVGGNAEYFTEVQTYIELEESLKWAKENNQRITIIGGGSNVLVDDDGVRGLVIHPAFKDIEYEEKDNSVFVTAGAGVMLDNLIEELVAKELWGLENLSSIPCAVGGSVIQNVGAYGAEAKDSIHTVHTIDTETLEKRVFENQECKFGYRTSFFKSDEGSKYLIIKVTFRLSKKPKPNTSYKDLEIFLKDNEDPSIQDIRDAVRSIRSAKFSRTKEMGTAGSFFKNPVISKEHFKKIQDEYPDLPSYEVDEENVKVPLGWILDHVCGLRGHTDGDVGLHEKQALILICKKGTSSKNISTFANKISDEVFKKTGIEIEREVIYL